MSMNRRGFLLSSLAATSILRTQTRNPKYENPLFELHRVSSSPVVISSIELLQRDSHYFVRTTSSDGAVGLTETKQMELFIPIFLKAVAPFFVGKDARDLESLIDGVYVQNYKMAGQAFWCPVAYVEQSIFDLLGKIASKPVAALLGGILRNDIPVYLSGSGRETTAEEEVDVYARGVRETGAAAVKFKIGGRMSRNADAYPGRTERMMALARKTLGDRILIYADANGSYDADKAIEVGRMLQDLKVAFFEEPCPWEELSETKRVSDALEMPVAAGEQDASLWRFQWMIQNRVMDIVQPDLNYNGGFIRAARVARMAREAGMKIVPHNTQTESTAANILHFGAATANSGPYMEFPHRGKRRAPGWYEPHFEIRNGKIAVPTGPGLGVRFDPDYIKGARRLS